MARPRSNERGVGVIGSIFGVCAFLGFLLLATHALLGLYATNVATSAAWNCARTIATQPESQTAHQLAQSKLEKQLAGLRNRSITIDMDNERVRVHVSATRPTFLPLALTKRASLTQIDRTATARIERVQ